MRNSKKLFGLLTSAALLLNAAPLNVLAEEMVEVETGGGTGTVGGTTTSQVALNATNFPDENLLQAIKDQNTPFGGEAPKNAAEVTMLNVPATVKNLEGLQYLTNLTSFAMGATLKQPGNGDTNVVQPGTNDPIPDETNNGAKDKDGNKFNSTDIHGDENKNTDDQNNELNARVDRGNINNYIVNGVNRNQYITQVDLTNCTKLEGIVIYGSQALTSVTLPNTQTLNGAWISGNTGLTSLDLSPAFALTDVNISNNDLSELDIKADAHLDSFNAENNDLYTLNLANYIELKNLNVNNNKLYELTIPTKKLERLQVAGNKLKSLDVSKVATLTTLIANDNMLESLKLPKDGAPLTTLNCANNHLASLDLTKVNFSPVQPDSPADNSEVTGPVINVTPQVLYANDEDVAIDIPTYDSKFNVGNVVEKSPKGGYFINEDDNPENGIFVFAEDPKNPTLVPSYEYDTGITIPAGIVNGTPSKTPDATKKVTFAVTIEKEHLLNRLYNPNSGEHFYTKSLNEKNTLVKLGWQDEGIGWVSPTTSAYPVYRLYNENAGDHHYTQNANEKDTLVTIGWKYEGIGWYSGTPEIPSTIEVFREYNPNAKAAGAHNYTINEVENHTLVSIGWQDEGIAWWALK